MNESVAKTLRNEIKAFVGEQLNLISEEFNKPRDEVKGDVLALADAIANGTVSEKFPSIKGAEGYKSILEKATTEDRYARIFWSGVLTLIKNMYADEKLNTPLYGKAILLARESYGKPSFRDPNQYIISFTAYGIIKDEDKTFKKGIIVATLYHDKPVLDQNYEIGQEVEMKFARPKDGNTLWKTEDDTGIYYRLTLREPPKPIENKHGIDELITELEDNFALMTTEEVATNSDAVPKLSVVSGTLINIRRGMTIRDGKPVPYGMATLTDTYSHISDNQYGLSLFAHPDLLSVHENMLGISIIETRLSKNRLFATLRAFIPYTGEFIEPMNYEEEIQRAEERAKQKESQSGTGGMGQAIAISDVSSVDDEDDEEGDIVIQSPNTVQAQSETNDRIAKPEESDEDTDDIEL